MKFSLIAFLAAAASSVVAQTDPTPGFDVLTHPTLNEVLEAGSTYRIKWDHNNLAGTVTLEVLSGDSAGTLQADPEPLSKNIVNTVGFYDWSVPTEPLKKAYGLRITLNGSEGKTFQWSNPFTIKAADVPNPPKETSSKASSSIKSRTTYTTVSLAPGPAYSVVPTTYPAVPTTTPVPVYNVTLPSSYSSNVTYVQPTSSKVSAAPTYPVEPTGPAPTGGEAPPQTTPEVPISGATSVGISGLALVGGLVLAFAL